MDEYEALIKRLLIKLKKEVGTGIKSVQLYGSVAKGEGRYVRGESDLDLFVVISDKVDYTGTLFAISRVLGEFYDDPIASSLLDVFVVKENEIPSAINPIRLLAAKEGKVLMGDDDFKGIDLDDGMIKQGAFDMACEFNTTVRGMVIDTGAIIDDDELYLCTEAVLGSAQAVLYFFGEKGFTRLEAGELLQKKLGKDYDAEVVIEATRFKIGGNLDDREDFFNRGMAFCQKVVDRLSEELSKG